RVKKFFLTSKGEFLILRGEYGLALKCLEGGYKYDQIEKDNLHMQRTLLGLSKVHAKLGDNEKAFTYAKAALDLARQSESKASIRDDYDQAHQQRDFLLLGIVLLLIIGAVSFRVMQLTRKQESNKRLIA